MKKRKVSTPKTGAVELSMTTVIVIILGVVLLTLGLAFVRGVFKKVNELTKKSFDQAKSSIGELGTIDKELTLTTNSIELEQSGDNAVGVVLFNLGKQEQTFQIKTTPRPAPPTNIQPKFACFVTETGSGDSGAIPLKSGERDDLVIGIVDESEGTPLGTYICKVELFKGGKSTGKAESILIKVIG